MACIGLAAGAGHMAFSGPWDLQLIGNGAGQQKSLELVMRSSSRGPGAIEIFVDVSGWTATTGAAGSRALYPGGDPLPALLHDVSEFHGPADVASMGCRADTHPC